jgi:hypothetical protein
VVLYFSFYDLHDLELVVQISFLVFLGSKEMNKYFVLPFCLPSLAFLVDPFLISFKMKKSETQTLCAVKKKENYFKFDWWKKKIKIEILF